MEISDVFVRSWKKRRLAIVFELSNGVTQANFKDGSEVFIVKEDNTVTYLQGQKDCTVFQREKLVQSESTEELV